MFVLPLPARMGTPRVLILEAAVGLRDVLTELLLEEGFGVLAFEAPDALLAAALAGRGDVAVVDGFGPSLTELGEAERAYFAGLGAIVPTILTSARPWARRHTPAELGVAGVMPKPYDLEALIALVRDVAGPEDPAPVSTSVAG